MSNSSIAVLVSGGLDSNVLLAEMTERHRSVWPIYIRQGLAWEAAELYWLKKFLGRLGARSLKPLKILALPMGDLYGAHWSTGQKSVPGPLSRDEAVYLPGRNMILSVKAAVFAAMNGIPALALGSLDHNPFPDATPRFFETWSAALSLGLASRLRIIAPYRRLSKVKVIRRGEDRPLHLSFSCIDPRGRWHCGRCNKCAERRRAFKAAGVRDRTRYANEIAN